MNKVDYLGELEQLLLWSVLRLGDDAYGLAIRDNLEERTGRSVARGAAYTTLDRLVRKGYLESWLGERSPRRAGRAKRYFRLTDPGRAALKRAYEVTRLASRGLEPLIENG